MEYERVHAAALITEKRAKNFDKVLGEWLSKANDVQAEVAASQDEGRNYSSELFRLKAAQDEAVEQLDIVKRENKNLADEIKDLLDQLGEGGRSIHDLDKQRRRLETEKEELQAALEEAEATLEMEENKVLRAQLELAQVAHAALCFLPSLRWPLLLLMQLEAPPFLFPICGAAYQDHEWSVLLLQVGQGDL